MPDLILMGCLLFWLHAGCNGPIINCAKAFTYVNNKSL
jgi:uncharacterized protein